ncbi:hypothetical protein FAM09_18345 [Niastella caeni]|uniref:Uncharacterized protein n=1 Tax=Niastella caeni TaxID=2569763 RepID=A0A4S8HSH4_9BACT|nr:hypothetical protein [Niastella caeni]THU36924.1 hypothetical protein FAM09_18345 [Niastella caeni]
MNQRIFDISYKKLITWLVPAVLRKSKTMALLNALVSPVVYIYNLFLINRRNNLYKLRITPQVCYVEMALNDKYDSSNRQIKIVQPKRYEPLYLFRPVENQPAFFFKKIEAAKPKTWLYQKGEASAFQYDFIVQVPATVVFDINEMTAVIDSYILPDKVYKISIV